MMLSRFYLVLLIGILFSGCAAVPYRYVEGIENERTLMLREGEPQIERGRPNVVIDGLGHYLFSLPSKIILWDWRVDNHDIQEDVEQRLEAYLQANGLNNVKVRLNQYSPGGEWSRLVRNREVNPFWRFTLGAITTTYYTILPGRIFGGDHYNPYTNTIHLYSGHTSIALHEGAHAKDTAESPFPGLYSASRMIPLVPLYQEGVATGDTVGYHRDLADMRAEKSDYKILYPAYGTYIGGEALRYVPISYPLSYAVQAGFALPGHIVGRVKAAMVDESPVANQEQSGED